MKLRFKILGVVGLTLVCAIGVIYIVTRGILLQSFGELEEREVRTNIARVKDALAEELSVLEMKGRDWSAWDDTRDFVLGKKPEYIEQNLNPPSLAIINMNFMIFADANRKIVYSRSIDFEGPKEVPTADSLLDYLMSNKSLLSISNVNESKKGIVILPDTQALVAILPISNSQNEEPVNGFLIVGRYLGNKQIKELGKRTHLNLAAIRPGDKDFPSEYGADAGMLSKETQKIKSLDADRVAGFAEVKDMVRKSRLLLVIEMPRSVMHQGNTTIGYALLAVALTGGILLAALIIALHFLVLKPLSILQAHVVSIGKSKDLSSRLNLESNDEIGTLGKEFNNMADSLQRGINEREQALMDLAKSETKYAQLFETESDAIFLLDGDTGEILDANPAAHTLYGYDKATFRKLKHLNLIANSNEQLATLSREPLRIPLSFHRRQDGTVFPAEVSLTSFEWNNRIILTGTVRDITERVRAEEDKAKMETQLRQGQKMKAIGQLAGGIAHDFNNLLHVILGHTDMAMEKASSAPAVLKNLESVKMAGDRAAALVSQLLLFSRQQHSERKNIRLNESIANLLGMLKRLLGENIEVTLHFSEEVDFVYADLNQVDQILMNLCVNARDAMPNGGRIAIETQKVVLDSLYCLHHPWAREGAYAMICVSDNGPGIPRDIQDRIFEPFFSTKDVGQGTGLGLATVYGIVKQHDGLIHLYSEEGGGTTFRIYLPLTESGETLEEKPVVDKRSLRGNETVLVAEDEEMIREMVEQILCREGYRVVLAPDGVEAIDILERHKNVIDFALLDVVMPRANGKDVFERIRQLKPDMPVLFCTGYSRNILDAALMPDANYEIIDKPYNPLDLLRQIRTMLDEARQV